MNDIPPCTDADDHAWVGGRARKVGNRAVEVVSRQCRRCGYEDVFEEADDA